MSFIKQYLYYLENEPMTTTLSVSNLEYEELVLLQEIMIDVWEFGIDKGHASYDKEVFDRLYDKVLRS
jgi:hypothetical protein|tara:strand:+ start:830 stop:1033 length:204 start_codon:yes stop_codon:yes gene_type:complete